MVVVVMAVVVMEGLGKKQLWRRTTYSPKQTQHEFLFLGGNYYEFGLGIWKGLKDK